MIKGRISIAIPAKGTEKFFERTIQDVLEKTEGDFEIFPVMDGPVETNRVIDPRVHYIEMPETRYTKKRHGINEMVKQSTGEYVMSLDSHCMLEKGWDLALKAHHKPNWVQVPRRHRLDAENWALQPQCDNRPPIDYEYIMFRPLFTGDHGLHGFKWDERTLARQNILIDDILTFQGSMWFMTREWFNKMGFMQVEGYTGWGQEAEEISLTTWLNGGEVKVNKNTWYAHLHKGNKYGRMYWMSREDNRKSYAYSKNKWVVENKEFFVKLINKFMPLPGWPTDWEKRLYEYIGLHSK